MYFSFHLCARIFFMLPGKRTEVASLNQCMAAIVATFYDLMSNEVF